MAKTKILLISWGAYPLRSGSSVLVNNLASQFSKEELVIVAEKPLDPDTNSWKTNWPSIYYLGKEISWPKRGKKYFRWIKWLCLPYYFFRLKSFAKKENFNTVISIFPNEYYLFLGYLVANSLKINFFPWFHNTYLENRSGLSLRFAQWLQPRVFREAKKVLVLSEGMKNYYLETYKDISLETLLHGFPLINKSAEFKESDKNKTIRFLFLGNFNQACIDASKSLISSIVSHPDYEVHICSPTPQWVFEREGIKAKNIIYHGYVEDLGERLKDYDVMLLPHGFEGGLSDIEYQTIFPTRTIFLLNSNKPVLAHAPSNCFLTKFLIQNKCAKVVTEKNAGKILQAIKEILEYKEETQVLIKNALAVSKMFSIEAVAENLRSIIRNN